MRLSVHVSRALLTQYLEKYWTYFHQTFDIGAFWDEEECFNFGGQKVKGQGYSMTNGPADRDIQCLTLCIDL